MSMYDSKTTVSIYTSHAWDAPATSSSSHLAEGSGSLGGTNGSATGLPDAGGHYPPPTPQAGWFTHFAAFVSTYHAEASVTLCILGAICNSCTIIVLSRPGMRNPVNAILVAMAVANSLMIIVSFIFTSYTGFVLRTDCDPRLHSWAWAAFVIVYAQVSLVAHSSSVWLSVTMAGVRIKIMRNRCARKQPMSMRHTLMLIGLVFAVVLFLNLPNMLMYTIHTVPLSQWTEQCPVDNITQDMYDLPPAHIPVVSDIASKAGLGSLAFYITGCAFKILPCIVLPVLIFWLASILSNVSKRRKRLCKLQQAGAGTGLASTKQQADPNKTTKMLIIIVCVFLLTELPQGTLAIMGGLLGKEFQREVYRPLADLLDLLALTNSCATFVIYCTMSDLFRQEARETFCPSRVARKYVRVEHRPSIVPDTPLFAALKANLASNKFISTAAGHHQHATGANGAITIANPCATSRLTNGHALAETVVGAETETLQIEDDEELVHVEPLQNEVDVNDEESSDDDNAVVLPAVTLRPTDYESPQHSEFDVML